MTPLSGGFAGRRGGRSSFEIVATVSRQLNRGRSVLGQKASKAMKRALFRGAKGDFGWVNGGRADRRADRLGDRTVQGRCACAAFVEEFS